MTKRAKRSPLFVLASLIIDEKSDGYIFLWLAGERCEDRGRTYQESCANQCPRSCTDLWEHVQCLQGACHSGNLCLLTVTVAYWGIFSWLDQTSFSIFHILHFSGCRCPKGQLLQDGLCVPVTECRCGIPSGNGTLEFDPKEEISIDCNTWWEQLCVNFIFRCNIKRQCLTLRAEY